MSTVELNPVNRSLSSAVARGALGCLAILLTDTNNTLLHWVIWDIPAATRSLPAMLAMTSTLVTPVAARQVGNKANGYLGPCPSGNLHLYRFDLHAIGVGKLQGLSAAPTTAQANAAILAASIGKTSLSGQSNAK